VFIALDNQAIVCQQCSLILQLNFFNPFPSTIFAQFDLFVFCVILYLYKNPTKMDYSYLNQGFDCPGLSGPMDPISSACQLSCSGYPGDPTCSGQLGPGGYTRYGPPVGATAVGAAGMSPMARASGHATNGSAAVSIAQSMAGRMSAAHRAHAESMQSSMFQTGIGLQSK